MRKFFQFESNRGVTKHRTAYTVRTAPKYS